MRQVQTFTERGGGKPVEAWIRSLPRKDVGKILAYVEHLEFGRDHILGPAVKAVGTVSNHGVWEMTIGSAGVSYLMFYSLASNRIVRLLHGTVVGTEAWQTSLETAVDREREWNRDAGASTRSRK